MEIKTIKKTIWYKNTMSSYKQKYEGFGLDAVLSWILFNINDITIQTLKFLKVKCNVFRWCCLRAEVGNRNKRMFDHMKFELNETLDNIADYNNMRIIRKPTTSFSTSRPKQRKSFSTLMTMLYIKVHTQYTWES